MSTYNFKIHKLLYFFINTLRMPLLLLLLCLSLKTGHASPLYVTEEGKVTDPIVKLMGLSGIRIADDPLPAEKGWPEAKLTLPSRNLEEVVKAVQGKTDPLVTWLGAGKERWEDDPSKPQLSEEQAKSVRDICFNDLGQGTEVNPQMLKGYKGILLLGTTLSGVRKRLKFLNSVYDKHKSLLKLPLHLLTGERTLDPAIGETKEQLYNPDNDIIAFRKDYDLPQQGSQKDIQKDITDEGEMMLLVLDQSHHPSLDSKNVTYVYSPKGSGKRATTESTVRAWLEKRKIEPGLYLAISNQPYVEYQEDVIRRALLKNGRSDITVDVVGSAPDLETGAEATFKPVDHSINLLNNLSRILWELSEIRKLEGKAGS